MPEQTKIYVLILGLWLVNYLPRMFPMVILSRLRIPEPVIWWLGFVPAAVLGAIIAPAVLMPENGISISFGNSYLVAAIPAFAVAIKTRSLVWTLLVGMAVMALVQV